MNAANAVMSLTLLVSAALAQPAAPAQAEPDARPDFATLVESARTAPTPEVLQGFEAIAASEVSDAVRRDATYNAGLVSIGLFDAAIRGPKGDAPPPTPDQLEAMLREAEQRFLAAYTLDRTDLDAARNVERTRLLLDQLRKAREQAEQQRQQANEMADQLEDLAQRQEQLAEDSKNASTEDAESLAERQRELSEETQEMLEQLSQSDASSPELSEAANEARDARQSQDAAQRDLDDQLPYPAAESQQDAAEALRRASEEARKAGQQPGEPQQGEQSGEGEPSDQQGGQEGEPQPGDPQDNPEGDEQDPLSEELADLDEQERKHRADREAIRRAIPTRGTGVERDW